MKWFNYKKILIDEIRKYLQKMHPFCLFIIILKERQNNNLPIFVSVGKCLQWRNHKVNNAMIIRAYKSIF